MGRTVWVNKYFTFGGLTATGANQVDLLSEADRSLTLGATIVSVKGQIVMHVEDPQATGSWDWRQALYIADIAQTTFPNLIDDALQPSWLWHNYGFWGGGSANISTAHHEVITLDVKSKRRFRENNKTLWFLNSVVETGVSSSLSIRLYTRTLLYVP